MCMICVDLIKQRMTLQEAKKNAREMNYTREGSDHYAELEQAIEKGDMDRLNEMLDEERGIDSNFTD